MQDQSVNGYEIGVEWQREREQLVQALDSAESRIRELETQLDIAPQPDIPEGTPPVNYQLAPDESIPDGLRRIALEQADRGYWQLTASTWDRDLAVHDARKSFKRVRAVLRLVRDEIDKNAFQQLNIVYRDASRHLSRMRDSAIMAITLEKLALHYAAELPDNTFATTHDRILEMHADATHTSSERSLLDQIATEIASARPHLATLPVADETFATVQQGIKRVYARGQRTMAHALEAQTPHAFHDWRKRVKYLRYQVGILSTLWPAYLDVLAQQFELLSDTLGDEHDLFELGELVQRIPALVDNDVERVHLLTLIDSRRRELQLAARPLGERLYAETPRNFSAQLAAYYGAIVMS